MDVQDDPHQPKIYALSEIEAVTNDSSFSQRLIQAIADGFVAFDKDEFYAAPIQTLGAPPMAPFGGSKRSSSNSDEYAAQTCVKSGYFRDNPYYVIKVASGGHPWKENSGLMQVFSQRTGFLEALLLDRGMLTELRTAAVGALATKLLAPTNMECIGVVGTGVQARFQLRMIATVTTCRKLLLWGRSADKAEALQTELTGEGWKVEIAKQVDDLLTACQVIVTTTSSREPVLGNSMASSSGDEQKRLQNLLIVCIGADAPGKIELNPLLVERAGLRVADHPQQSKERGEFQAWCKTHSAGDLVSLGQLVQDEALHRGGAEDDRCIILDSSGVALQDCVVAQMVYEALLGGSSKEQK